MFRKGWRIPAAILIVGFALWVAIQGPAMVEGDDNQITPGSVDDPVVTKSYVDQKIAALTGGSPNNASTDTGNEDMSSGGAAEAAAAEPRIVNVPVGKTMIAKDGAQVIVRAGKAVAYSPDSNGIADVTDGIDIKSGSSVKNNHLLLFPRGGRGISTAAGQKTGLTVMITGQYDLVLLPDKKSGETSDKSQGVQSEAQSNAGGTN